MGACMSVDETAAKETHPKPTPPLQQQTQQETKEQTVEETKEETPIPNVQEIDAVKTEAKQESTVGTPVKAANVRQKTMPKNPHGIRPSPQSLNRVANEITLVEDNEEDAFGLMLCGAGESGKTTFTRQLKLRFLGNFTEEERKDSLNTMRGNMMDCMQYLVSWCEKNHVAIEGDEMMAYANDIVDEDPYECDFTEEIAEKLKVLWSDKSIQMAFQHNDQLPIPDNIEYFFDKVEQLASDDYIPTNEDVLKARIRTVGIGAITLDLKGARTRIFDVGGQKSERSKWSTILEKVEGIIYCVSVADFDKPMFENTKVLRINDSLEIFKNLSHQQKFQESPIFLVCNKLDIFNEKVKNTDSFARVFPEYKGDIHDPKACISYLLEKFYDQAAPLSENRPIITFKIVALQDDDVIQTASEICKFISDKYYGD